jgi:tetratricopeptide (TPR) repeat protein
LTKAHDINDRIGNSDGLSVTSYMLAQCAIARDDNDRAAVYAERSRLESTQSSNQEGLALANRLLGEIDMHEQRWQQAIEHLTMAVGLSGQIGDPARDAAALVELAEALFKVGRVSEAHTVIERAQERAARTNVSGIDDRIAQVVAMFSAG